LNLSAIIWLSADGHKPTDGKEPPPRCLLEGLATLLDVTCDVAFVAVNIIGFGLLGIVLVIAFLMVKRRLVALYCLFHNAVSAAEQMVMEMVVQYAHILIEGSLKTVTLVTVADIRMKYS
jgi:hypothetical protein